MRVSDSLVMMENMLRLHFVEDLPSVEQLIIIK